MPHEVFLGAPVDIATEDTNWYFHVKGDNGEIVCVSEAYTRKADAERGYQDLLGIMQPDFVRKLLKIMFTGWMLREQSWDKGKEDYTRNSAECMVEAAGGDELFGYLLHLFDYWGNDIQQIGAHYGIAIVRKRPEDDGDFEEEGACITHIRDDIPPAPSSEHYWDKGQWVAPPVKEQKEVTDG